MKTMKLVVVVVATIIMSAAILYAQEARQEPEQDQGIGQQFQQKMAEELQLTQEQQQKLSENRKGQRQEAKRLITAIKEKQEKLQLQLRDPAVTKAKLKPFIDEIKSLQAQMIEQRINGIFAVRSILTPEQFVKFQENIQKMKKNRKGRFQYWNKNELDREGH